MTSLPDARRVRAASAAEVPAYLLLLGTLPLFFGFADNELEALARVTRVLDVPDGTVLWREGDEADGLLVIAGGTIRVESRLPGEREVEIATLGRGEVLGEIALLGGGRRTAGARAVEASAVLFLGRVEFGGLVSGASPGALMVRRRILALVCERFRWRHEALAASLGGGPPVSVVLPTATPTRGEVAQPREDYLRRLPFFRTLDRTSTAEVLRRADFIEVPVSHSLVEEGAPATACWITINGAVEELIRRGDQVIRVGLAGPGAAFGYLGLIDGLPSPVAAATRERAQLLVLPAEEFAELFDPAVGATAFSEAVQRDLVRAMLAAARPQARLAAAKLGS